MGYTPPSKEWLNSHAVLLRHGQLKWEEPGKIEPDPGRGNGWALLVTGVIVASGIIIAVSFNPDLHPEPMAPATVMPAQTCTDDDVLTMNVETGDITCEPYLEPPWLEYIGEPSDCIINSSGFLCEGTESIVTATTCIGEADPSHRLFMDYNCNGVVDADERFITDARIDSDWRKR